MLEKNQVISLMKAVCKAKTAPKGVFSYQGENLNFEDLNETLRNQFLEIAGDYNLYRQHKTEVFELIEEALDDIVPEKALQRYMDIAQVKVFAQGDRPIFTRKTGRTRAKQFITRVGLAGIYEVFKLSGESFEVQTSAMGGAAQIGFEEFLDKRADFAELVSIVMEGMDELIYREIAVALQASMNQMPEANQVITNGFKSVGMDRLIQVASVYGSPTIYCTYEFAVNLIPPADQFSDRMKDERWEQGYLGKYKGCPVVVLPQAFEDETNSRKLIDPGYAWVIPTGANMRPVCVAFEGTTHARERENEDWSRDIQVYRKVGVGVMMTNNICVYKDTNLAGKLDVSVSLG